MTTFEWPSQGTYLYGLQLVNHGGKCCGIKTVYGFSKDPDDDEMKLDAINGGKPNRKDAYGHNVTSNMRFFTEAAPEETGLERLKRYIAYMEKNRPQNILEAVLAEYDGEDGQYEGWHDTLISLGFKEVNSHRNSNSDNICHVYHLNIGTRESMVNTDDDDDEEYESPW